MFLQVVYASLVLILLIIKPVAGDGYFRCKEHEKQALLEIKQELEDEYGILSSWSSESDCCRNWRGVRCSNRTDHVIMLDLHREVLEAEDAWLSGNISPSLLKLRHLKYLDLSFNGFHESPILDLKGALGNLRHVNFARSGFGGTLSYQFANLSRLQSLDLSHNDDLIYTPESIHWLSSLSSIQVLDLSFVDLSRVKDLFQVVNTLPYLKELRLGRCGLSDDLLRNLNSSGLSLEVVDLFGNAFTSSVYPWLLSFSNSLQELSLADNDLHGFIPDSMGNMTSLVDLDLFYSHVQGGVPKSFGRRLCNLKRLDLSDNILEDDFEILVGNISGCMEKSLEILKLDSNILLGSLPDISIFTNLREVDLSNNQLNGSLPEKFMHPSKLEFLYLFNNELTGSLSDVVMLPFLKRLDIRGNRLDGTVSQSIGSLSELEELHLSENSLKGTMSETHFLNLSKLKILDLSGNSLSLNLSQSWTAPFQLDFIGLGSCKYESRFFPKWIQTQKNCTVLDISGAGILDIVPRWIWDFSSSLGILNLSSNSLRGKLPDMSITAFGNFSGLDLSSNKIEGELPSFPPTMTSINLSGNKFSGNLSVLCRITDETFNLLDLSNNLLTGKIPYCLSQWERLVVLNLANNRLSGEIPFAIGQHVLGIKALDLHNNSFHGNLPSSLSNCHELEFMDLSENNLSGALPAWIGQNLSTLIFLSLKSNYFSGVIPKDFCKLVNIRILDLAINNISGVIPECIYNLTYMVTGWDESPSLGTDYHSFNDDEDRPDYASYMYKAIIRWRGREDMYGKTLGLFRGIDLSSNRLTGEIPSEITSLVELRALNLSRNEFFGKISEKIGDLKEIESLDLSNNHLSGGIPSSLSNLSFLSYLDLSNNNLSGRIPTSTQIEGLNGSAFSGNIGLCGKPLETKCVGENTTEERERPEKEDSDANDDDDKFWTRFYAGIGLGFIIGLWGICIIPMLKREWRVSYLGFIDYLILKFHILLARCKNSRP